LEKDAATDIGVIMGVAVILFSKSSSGGIVTWAFRA
jgi:hypothetical protein